MSVLTLLPDLACPLEINWRLQRDRWGRGLASESSLAIVDFAFETFQPDHVLAVCFPDNAASSRVMSRIGMQRQGLQHGYGMRQLTNRMDVAQWCASLAARPVMPSR